MNRVTLVGHVGQDPESRALSSGKTVTNLSVATSERWTDKASGEKKERTEWHRVVVWGFLAELARDRLSKGSKVMVEGQLQTRKWTDQSGNEKYTTEVVLQGPGSVLELFSGERGSGEQTTTARDFDDEIPF